MTTGDSSSETGGPQPEQEELSPEAVTFIAEFLESLGPDGVDALKNIELAERDLRTISSFDPRLIHALDRADHLLHVRVALREFLARAAETLDNHTPTKTLVHALGDAAITERPKKNG